MQLLKQKHKEYASNKCKAKVPKDLPELRAIDIVFVRQSNADKLSLA